MRLVGDFATCEGSAAEETWLHLLRLRRETAQNVALATTSSDTALLDIFAPLLRVSRSQSYVIAQMGQSLDGRIATVTGDSFFVNGPEGIDHLHRLRAFVDAIVIGVGTAIADDPRLTVRRCAGPSPARVVLDPNGRLPHDARLFQEQQSELIIVRAVGAPPAPEPAITLYLSLNATRCFEPATVIAELAKRGYFHVLVEGGARTVSHFIETGVVDRLHVLVSALLIGSGQSGLQLPPVERLSGAQRPKMKVHLLSEQDVLFDCELERANSVAEGSLGHVAEEMAPAAE